jgi:hypothetical protein
MPWWWPRWTARRSGCPGVEAELAGQPRHGAQHEDERQHRPGHVPASPEGPRGRDSAAREGDNGEGERHQDAQGRDRVDRLRIEIRLLDDPGHRDDRAEHSRDGCDERGPTSQPLRQNREHADGDERGRVVEEDEGTPCAGREAGAADVVELLGGKAGVGDPHLDGDDAEENPDGQDLGKARARGVGGLQPA